MEEYTLKVNTKYDIDPQKVVEDCKGNVLLTDKNPNLCLYPAYDGIKGRYHTFSVPSSEGIGVLVESIESENELVRNIIIEINGE